MSIIIVLTVLHRLCPSSAVAGIWGIIIGSIIGLIIKYSSWNDISLFFNF